MSSGSLPPLSEPRVKLKGFCGLPQASTYSVRVAPVPCPSMPWHCPGQALNHLNVPLATGEAR